MANNSEKNLPTQQEIENAESSSIDRSDQFNELSELSLEERMNVADQMGIPADNVGEAAATGTTQLIDSDDGTENTGVEESTNEQGGR